MTLIKMDFIIEEKIVEIETNPLSPQSDQHQISPCDINAL